MKSFYRTLLCVLMAGVAGCISIKHQYLTAPRIDGTVTRAGQPVAGIHVQLVDVLNDGGEPAKASIKQEAVTDAQGHFTVGPIKRETHKTDVPLFNINQHTVPWGLRLSNDDQTWDAGWLSDPTMFGDVPKTVVTAACDLAVESKSSVIDGDIAIVGKGPCDLKVAATKKK